MSLGSLIVFIEILHFDSDEMHSILINIFLQEILLEISKCSGKNLFNSEWLTDDRFKLWLQKVSSDSAKCKLCCKTFSVSNADVSNVINHSNGNIHKSKVAGQASYSTIALKNPNEVSQPNKDSDLLLRKLVTSVHAEIRLVLKVALLQFSLRSCLDVNELFQTMSSDSKAPNISK